MENTIKKQYTGPTYGLIGGLVLIIFFLLLYMGGVEYFLSPISWLGYLLIIIVAVLAGIRQKKVNGGFLSFSEGLKVVFTVFALAFLLHTIFNYILLNYIDVSFRDALTPASMEKAAELMKRFGASENQIEEAMEKAAKNDNNSLSSVLLGYGILCIVFFIISLIIAAIIQKKKQPF